MSADRPDEFDDIPSQRALPPDAPERDDYRDPFPEPRPGFGFWMAVVWCVLFFVATQIVIAIGAFIVIFIVAAIADKNVMAGQGDMKAMMKSDTMMVVTMLTVMCSHMGGVLFAWIIMRWQIGRQWKRKIALSRLPSVTHALLTLIGLVAMLAVGGLVESVVVHVVPSLEDILKAIGLDLGVQGSEMIPEMIKATPLALALFTVGVLPALDEELWCRGFIAHGLSQRYGTLVVIAITSFLFGCLHVDPRQGLGAMFLGMVMHAAYVATRSLWVPMALHFLNNSLAVLHFADGKIPGVQKVPLLQPFENALKGAPALFAIGAVFLFGAVAYAMWQTRCKLVSVDPRLAWEPPGVSGVELPPPGSGTVVAHDRLSPLSVALVLVGAVAFGAVMYWKGV